jgi:hypothetical protein
MKVFKKVSDWFLRVLKFNFSTPYDKVLETEDINIASGVAFTIDFSKMFSSCNSISSLNIFICINEKRKSSIRKIFKE